MKLKYWLFVGAVAIDQITKGAKGAIINPNASNQILEDGQNAMGLRGLTDSSVNCVSAFDLALVLDRSGSKANDFGAEKSAVGAVASQLEPSSATSPYPINFGIVTFSVYGTNILSLGSYDPQTLANAIYSIPFSGGGTELAKGLIQVSNQLPNRRKGVPLKVMIASDFNDDFPADAVAQAQAIQANGDVVFMCFGIANGVVVNSALMGQLCTDPKNIYYYPDYPSLQQDAPNVAGQICNQLATNSPTVAPSKATKTPSVQPSLRPTAKTPTTATPSTSPSTAPTTREVPPAFPPGAAAPIALAGLVALALLLCVRCKKRVVEAESEEEVRQIVRDVEQNIVHEAAPPEMIQRATFTRGKTTIPTNEQYAEDQGAPSIWTAGIKTHNTKKGDYKPALIREGAPKIEQKPPIIITPPKKKPEPTQEWTFALSPLPWPIPPVVATKFLSVHEMTTCACCGGPRVKTGPTKQEGNRGTTDTDIHDDAHGRPSADV